MRRLQLGAIIGITLVGVIMIPPVLGGTMFPEYYDEKMCFETKEFLNRAEADLEYSKWKDVLGDKFAGGDFNGLSYKSISPTPLTICVFTNR